MALTDILVRSTKPAAKPQKLFDGGGLFLLVHPNGSKYWRWKYRVAGKEKLLALGIYPDVSLRAARAKRDDARALLASGVDPGQQRKAIAAAAADDSMSFEVIANEWLAKRDWVPGYRVKVVAWFANDVFPWIGRRHIDQLRAPDFLSVARRIESRGAIESAHRIMQNCSQVMRYAVATGRAERDPVADLRGALTPAPERNFAAVTDPRELGGLLRAMDAYTGTWVVKSALRLAPLVFQRPGELRETAWREIDLDAAEWIIPKARTKTKRADHLVPLSTQAVAVLRDLEPLSGRGLLVFPGARDRKRPMSNNTITGALRRMGFDKDTVTGHGFRATARTILDEELGFRPDIIEHQLAHTVKDPNGRAYNRTSHLPERRRMMQRWADYLDELKAGA